MPSTELHAGVTMTFWCFPDALKHPPTVTGSEPISYHLVYLSQEHGVTCKPSTLVLTLFTNTVHEDFDEELKPVKKI